MQNTKKKLFGFGGEKAWGSKRLGVEWGKGVNEGLTSTPGMELEAAAGDRDSRRRRRRGRNRSNKQPRGESVVGVEP
jgi:hypothetical protein